MAQPVLMPKQGITVESCIITGWMKNPGDAVKMGDILFTYETDKAAFEVEAESDGVLLAVFFPEGEDIPVLTPVAAIGAPGEDVSSIDPRNGQVESTPEVKPQDQPADEKKQEVVQAVEIVEEAPKAESQPAKMVVMEGTGKVSPRARALAANVGLDASLLMGTGPEGRVIERDVRARLAAGPVVALEKIEDEVAAAEIAQVEAKAVSQGEYQDEKLSGVRRAIAKSMMQSLTSMAQLTLSTSFDATSILETRKLFKASQDAEIQGITPSDMVLFAVSRALMMQEHRHFNANLLEGDVLRTFNAVNLAFATDTPRGLLVPVIFGADKLSLRAISVEVKRLAGLAREGKISPDLLSGGSFTVSNLGGLGIEHFTPVINPPQTGILGINNVTYRAKDLGGALYPAMGLSITFDHRAVDGAPAARFVRDIGKMLENFTALLAG